MGEWPDEADESSFLAEAAARGDTPAPKVEPDALPLVGDKLPPLDAVVAKVPAPVMALLDDLFRAKFTSVRRYSAVGAPSDPTKGSGGKN